MRILVIGAGGVGSAFVPTALRRSFFEHIVVADYDVGRAEAAVARYREIKREPAGRYDFSEWVLNDLAYKLAGAGKVQEAVRILRLNVEEYAASANVYDSLADVCYRSGEKACALENYRKALEKNVGNKKAAEMLERLGSPSNPTP